jgi:hypothetical protein
MRSDDEVLALIAKVRHSLSWSERKRLFSLDVSTVCDQLEGRINKPKQAVEHLTGGKFRTNVKFDKKKYQRHLLRSPSERMHELRAVLEHKLKAQSKGG